MRGGRDQQQEIKPCSVFKTLDADADGNGVESIEFEHNRSLNAALVYVVKYKKCLICFTIKAKNTDDRGFTLTDFDTCSPMAYS